MQAKTFLLTLGLGIATGSAAVLMLPPQSKARQAAQSAVNKAEQKMTQMMQ